MRRSIKIVTTVIVCATLLLGQSLTCLASNQPEPKKSIPEPIETPQGAIPEGTQTSPSEGAIPEPIETPQGTTHNETPPQPTPPLAPPQDKPVKTPQGTTHNGTPPQPVISEGPTFAQIESILEFRHTSIPDNSTPADYDLPGDSWNVYALTKELHDAVFIPLFRSDGNEIVFVENIDQSLYKAELLEKLNLVPVGFELTANLNDLVLFMADGSHFPKTRSNGQLFTGTMQILPYNGVVHHVVISEEYTVRPGDTISQIILDCGWLPEGDRLYGPDGYLARYAEQQGIDLDRPIIPGEVLRWHSEDIQVVDNLYPDITINIIPGEIFSGGIPAPF